MKITEIKKDINNTDLCKLAAKNLGLKTEIVRSGPRKTLLHITDGKKFYLASSVSPGMFPKAQRWVAHFTGSKLLVQKLLKRLGYNVIPSKEMRVADFSSEKELCSKLLKKRLSFPVLVKPDKGMNAKNISIAENHFHLTKIAKRLYRDERDFMIQPIVSNQTEYRILVVNNKVVLMHSKETYHVKGDGVSTIKNLISKVHPEKTDPTYIAWQHKKLNTKPSTILKRGEKFEYHLTRGADNASFYRTKDFPVATKKWALKLAKDISTSVVGIDVFIPGKFTDTSKYTVIELNTNPGVHYLVACANDRKTGLRIFTDVLRDYFNLKK